MQSILKKAANAAGFVLLIFAVMTGQMWYGEYLDDLASIEHDAIGNVSGAIEETKTDAAASYTSDEIQSFVDAAQMAAQQTAQLQFEMWDVIQHESDETFYDAFMQAQDEMKMYSSEEDFYTWIWYSWDEERCEGVAWTGHSGRDMDESGVPVVWLCRDGDGRILAYASAWYQPVSGKFVSFQKGVTSVGVKAAPFESSYPEEDDENDTDGFLAGIDEILSEDGLSLDDFANGEDAE